MKNSKVFSLLTLFIIFSLLIGCSTSQTTMTTETTEQANTLSETPKPVDTAITQEPTSSGPSIIIKHWYHQYGEDGTYEAALKYAEEYMKLNPNVKIEVTWVPGDYFAALNTALLSEDAPDVFELQTVDLSRVRSNQVAPLDDLFTKDILSDFNEAAIQRVTVDGKLYGVPMIVDPQFVYYRKSLLEAAGVNAPKNMDDLINAVKKLDDGRIKGLYVGNDLGSTTYLLYMNTFAAGTDLINSDNKVSFNTDKNALMWQKKQELAKSGSLLVGATTEWWDPGALIDGLAAMQYCGLWAMPKIVSTFSANEIGVIPWPGVDENTNPAVFVGGWNESVNAKSKNLEAAKAYVKWLWIENIQVQQDWNLSYGFHIPPRKSTASSATQLQNSPALDVIEIMNKYGKTTPITWTGAMDSIYVDASGQVLLKGADPKEELAKAAEAIQKELDNLLSGK